MDELRRKLGEGMSYHREIATLRMRSEINSEPLSSRLGAEIGLSNPSLHSVCFYSVAMTYCVDAELSWKIIDHSMNIGSSFIELISPQLC
jgi:hypothetical protein